MQVASPSTQNRLPRPPSHRKPVGSQRILQETNPGSSAPVQYQSSQHDGIASDPEMSTSTVTNPELPLYHQSTFDGDDQIRGGTPQDGRAWSYVPNSNTKASSAAKFDVVNNVDHTREQSEAAGMQTSTALPIRSTENRPLPPEHFANTESQFKGFRFPFSEPTSATPSIIVDSLEANDSQEPEEQPQLQYFHHGRDAEARRTDQRASVGTTGTSQSSESEKPIDSKRMEKNRPISLQDRMRKTRMDSSRASSGQELSGYSQARGRSLTPQERVRDQSRSSGLYSRALSASSDRSGSLRPSSSYADLLNIPHAQQMAQQLHAAESARFQASVGAQGNLLEQDKTLELYRANVEKINELRPQFEFALLLVDMAKQPGPAAGEAKRKKYIKEAQTILQKLTEKSYPFAQYYLADGYASGFFNDEEPDNHKAFPLFVAAAKRGHAEAAYRAGLCYEFGWGTRRDLPKAVQYFRQSAKNNNHPGAAIRLGKAYIQGGMGLEVRPREGVTLLKIAEKYADRQHNAGPFELGCLHEVGFDAGDAWKDDAYVVQLFARSAELGHPEANFRLGQIYEKGQLTCPIDMALSIHYYNCAAEAGIPEAMMVLSASFIVGVPPILEQDYEQAYVWAMKASETGLPMALYTVGWCRENGIGCNRDPLDANVWYRSAAEQGDERAIKRLQKIMGEAQKEPEASTSKLKPGGKLISKKKSGLLKGRSDGSH